MDFAKALSQISQSMAEASVLTAPPYIHCSKINGFAQLLRNIAPLLGTATQKTISWGQRNAMASINNVIQEFKLTHQHCTFENCANFALSVSISSVYNQVADWLKDLKKDFEQLGITSANEFFKQELDEIDQQETVDLKRISEIITQLRDKNTKARKDVERHVVDRARSLSLCGFSLNQQAENDLVILNDLPSSLNLVLQHEDLEFGKQIGDGNSGRVVKGKIKSTGLVVAIKILHTRQLSNKEMERFRNEIFAMSILNHPSLLQFCGYTQEPPYCIATKFMENGSLFHVLSKKPDFLTPTDRTLIAYDIARGMEFLHARGVIHRDLKSLNILIDENKRAKISDFGFVRMKSSVPMTGLIGTVHWMAPETLLSDPHYTEKIDVYSYGILLWELLTSKQPYADQNANSLPIKITNENLRPEIPKDTPPKLKHLIETCWSKYPEQRPSFKDIVTFFSDPEYHFPGSERFTFLRETGTMGMHTKTASDSEFPRRPPQNIRKIQNSRTFQQRKNETIIAIKRISESMKQGHIQAFKNSIANFRNTFNDAALDWSSVATYFTEILKEAPSYFKGFLIQVYFEMLMYPAASTAYSPETIVEILNDKEKNIVQMTLTLLASSKNPLFLTKEVLNALLEFRKNGDQELRIKAVHCILTLGCPKTLKGYLNKLLMFALRKLPVKRLQTLMKMAAKVIDYSTPEELDNNIFRKLMAIAENTPFDCLSATNECIYLYYVHTNSLPDNYIQNALDHYDKYKFMFRDAKKCNKNEIPKYVKNFIHISNYSKAGACKFASVLSENDDYCKETINQLPLNLPKENLSIIYDGLMHLLDAAHALKQEEFYVVAPDLLRSSNYEKVANILKNEASSLHYAEKHDIFHQLLLLIDATDDKEQLVAYISLLFNYIRRTGNPLFCSAAPRLSEIFNSNDQQLSPISFACLALLSKFKPPGINLDQLHQAAAIFSKTMTGTVQALAAIFLTQKQ